MDISVIKELIQVMSNSDICDLEIELDNLKVKLSKGRSIVEYQQPTAPAVVTTHSKPESTVEATPVRPANIVEVTAPMVGTFYRAASPTSEPFVTEGVKVKKGQSLCIIEAMKLMNEIESEYNGKLVEILVENGQAVEYGQPLFLLELAE